MLKSIALTGNPNCGKTTLFNQLTGANQTVGNWPGVTVDKYSGSYTEDGTNTKFQVVDLPGCYSLVATEDLSLDERITCNYVLNNPDSIYLHVIDVTHMARDLYLLLQLLERKLSVVVAVNCMDLSKAAGVDLDVARFSQLLGCPVVPISAKKAEGIAELKKVISSFKGDNNYSYELEPGLQAITELWSSQLNIGQTLSVLEGDTMLSADIDLTTSKESFARTLPIELDMYIALDRRQRLQDILQSSCVQRLTKSRISEYVDNLVLHKFWGQIIFLIVMYGMFTFAINLGGFLQQWFEHSSEILFVTGPQILLGKLNLAPWLINIVTAGLGKGISITLTFVPVLAIMFFCLAVLEHSGYMARAAFIVDKLMCMIGLSGRAFVPMIVGFGCNVPAVMGARCLKNQQERILTIIMTPFMSCSARLAIYALFVAAFFPHGGQNIIFSLYVVGILVAIVTALLLRDILGSNRESMSIMEMPEYRWPLSSTLFRQVWSKVQSFIVKAGAMIVLLCIIINGIGMDYLASVGKFLTPLFTPMGISPENWPATVGLLTGLVAKEAVVGTLHAFYASDVAMVQSFGGPIAAYAYLLFTLLYFPCVSVIAAISKELNIRWAMFSVLWSSGLAYLLSTLFFQLATLRSWWLIISLCLCVVAFFIAAKRFARGSVSVQRKMVPTTISLNS